ncbi:hypothetical protein EG328_009344 [Venturia inaequalis]|uniref:Secreted protein n=1 Tax=Venturia inaequalis TaxID=5025 RepID=A0A8H3V9N1_VENIN|nr:hypothetical protein EG328_009344 [Venturia inaequalis]
MFQSTRILTLLAFTTSTLSSPNDLEKRYSCLPSVPAADCTAKATFFNACVAKNEVPVATCYNDSINVTAANPNGVPNTTTPPLEKRYSCLPTVPIDDCTAKATYFAQCTAANLVPVATCYTQSLNITASANKPVNPAPPVPTTAPNLNQRYECAADVTADECLRRKQRFDNCVANGGVVSDCYANSMLSTLSRK